MERRAFVMRMNPGGHDLLPKALEQGLLMTGWTDLSNASARLPGTSGWIKDLWFKEDPDYRRAGANASSLWTFLAGVIPIEVGVQAKFWQNQATMAPIQQLLDGMKKRDEKMGLFITTAEIPDEVRREAAELAATEGLIIHRFDGIEFAGLLVDRGLRALV